MKVLRFGHLLKSGRECGCGFKHDRTLEFVFISSLSEALDMFEDLELNPPYAVFYDEVTYKVAGRLVKEKLAAKGVLMTSPTFQEAERGVAEARGAKTVIGVGGGMVIDLAKYAAYKLEADFISVPTAPSHDGMVSPVVSLFEEGRRRSILARSPRIAIVDLSVLKSAPRQLLISGYGDILAKIVSMKDWQLGRDERGEPYCKTAESLVFRSLNELIGSLIGPPPPA
ncbi:MAG: iron-containing alcohol dehydrogenase [Thaumarchaeota archaeon]|nr:iron-containing alcohol dehydrogenase [Nitrososphaerota archaeon]